MTSKNEERLEVARIAAQAADLASVNIRKYLEAHNESTNSPVKPVNRVMKIADDLNSEMLKVIQASAVLAEKSLKKFLEE